MPFDKIPKTRRTKTVAKNATDEDEVDSSAFRCFPDGKRSANIARHPEDLGFPEIVQESGEGIDSGAVPVHFIKKIAEEKYALRKLEDTQIETEDLSGQFVAKPDDVTLPAQDSEKKAEKKYSYTYCEMFWSVVAIGSYIVDIGSDCFIAYMYFNEHWWWFGLTLGFALVSSLTITVVSLTWYRQDQLSNHKEFITSRAEWIFRIALHFLQLGPVVRYADTIRYGLQSRQAEKSRSLKDRDYWHIEKAFADTDATLLRLFECYLEAAPQLTLQLYIIMHNGKLSEPIYFAIGQIVCCISSLTSIAWALTSYHAALRYSLSDKSNMNNSGITVMFLWRLCSVTARVLAFALFASLFDTDNRVWITPVIVFHVAMVFLWVLYQRTAFCGSRASEVLFGLVAALLNTFDYFNLTEGHTRLRYLLFYILIFVEYLAMTLTFFFVGRPTTPFYVYPVVASILSLHLIAVAVQVLYYLRFHPNNSSKGGDNRIQRCIPCFVLLGECCPRPERHDKRSAENGDL